MQPNADLTLGRLLAADRHFDFNDLGELAETVRLAGLQGLHVGFTPSSDQPFALPLTPGLVPVPTPEQLVGDGPDVENALMVLHYLALRAHGDEYLQTVLREYGVFAPGHHLGETLTVRFANNPALIVGPSVLAALHREGVVLVVLSRLP